MIIMIHSSGAPPTSGEEGGVVSFDDITREFNEGYSSHLSVPIDEVYYPVIDTILVLPV